MTPRARLMRIGGALVLVPFAAFVFWRETRKPTDAEVEACRFVLDRERIDSVSKWRARAAGEGQPEPEPGTKSDTLKVCAPLHLRPACRQAMEHAHEGEPSSWMTRMARACRDEYCDVLPQKPAICTKEPESPREAAQQFHELDDAILEHDVGRRARPIIELRARATREVAAAITDYFDAGSPAWTGSHGTEVRMIQK